METTFVESRRERVRQSTIDEIKEIARAQINRQGAAARNQGGGKDSGGNTKATHAHHLRFRSTERTSAPIEPGGEPSAEPPILLPQRDRPEDCRKSALLPIHIRLTYWPIRLGRLQIRGM